MIAPATNLSMGLATIGTGGDLSGPTFWMPEQASTVASSIDWIFLFITYLCYFFFFVIVGVMGLFIWKYRRRPGVHAQETATHNTPLELTWTIIPLILVIAIFYVGMKGYVNLRQAPEGAYEVNVTAQKWSWTFQHRNGCVQVGELYVPYGRPVRLIMSSQDVLHAVFIPAFRVKQDVVPGRITSLWFDAAKPGEYDLYCAEYCGTQHSTMLARVHVYEEDEFQVMLDQCANDIIEVPDAELHCYAARKLYPFCKSCHSLDGSIITGPSWQSLWESMTSGSTVFTDGTTVGDLIGEGKDFETPEDYLYQSIINPQQKIVENFTGAMPTFKGQLNDRKIRALIEFIKRLDEFELDERGEPIVPEGCGEPVRDEGAEEVAE